MDGCIKKIGEMSSYHPQEKETADSFKKGLKKSLRQDSNKGVSSV